MLDGDDEQDVADEAAAAERERVREQQRAEAWTRRAEREAMGIAEATPLDLDAIEARVGAATDFMGVNVLPDIRALVAEVRRLRADARAVAQVLIEEVGSDGPMSAMDAAQRAVAEVRRLRAISKAALDLIRADRACENADAEKAWDALCALGVNPDAPGAP